MREYQLHFVGGHVEVYDHTGKFLFSADSEKEAKEDLQLLFTA